jgi:hypothetical protein
MKTKTHTTELTYAAKEFLNAYKLNYKAELELRRTDKALLDLDTSLYGTKVWDTASVAHDCAIGVVVDATKNFVERMGEFARLVNVELPNRDEYFFTTRDEFECKLIDLANDIINSK